MITKINEFKNTFNKINEGVNYKNINTTLCYLNIFKYLVDAGKIISGKSYDYMTEEQLSDINNILLQKPELLGCIDEYPTDYYFDKETGFHSINIFIDFIIHCEEIIK